jgi:hypothetical protein
VASALGSATVCMAAQTPWFRAKLGADGDYSSVSGVSATPSNFAVP